MDSIHKFKVFTYKKPLNISQQTFVGLQDVFKISWRHVLKTSSTRLQCNNFSSSRHLARCLEDVMKTSWKTKNCYAEDILKTSWRNVFKTSWRPVLKTSWRQGKCLLGLSVSNHGLLTNLNQYLINLYLTNLYLMNLRRIQNAWIRTQ